MEISAPNGLNTRGIPEDIYRKEWLCEEHGAGTADKSWFFLFCCWKSEEHARIERAELRQKQR